VVENTDNDLAISKNRANTKKKKKMIEKEEKLHIKATNKNKNRN
jgi:hypothetical protein